MKLKSIFFFVIVLLSMQLQAQKVEWGEEFKTAKKNTLDEVIGQDENHFYALERGQWKGESTDYFLLKFDKNATLIKKEQLVLKDPGEKARSLNVIKYYNGQILMFSNVLNKDKTKKLLVRETLDPDSFQRIGKKKVILSPAYKKSKHNYTRFLFHFSKNEEYYSVEEKTNRTKEGVLNSKVNIYNSINELQWSRSFSEQKDPKFKQKHRSERLLDFKLDQDGNYYTLEFEYADKKDKKDGYYEIRKHFKDSDDPLVFKPSLSDKDISNLQFETKENGDIRCVGFYRKAGSGFGSDGVFSLLMDGKNGTIRNTFIKKFDLDFVYQNSSEKTKEKVDKRTKKGKSVNDDLDNYTLDDLIVREDGSSLLIGEQYYVTSHTVTTTDANGNTSTTTYYTYHYNEIIAVDFDSKGDINWMKKIPKIQSNRSPALLGYTGSMINNTMHILFNDCFENEGLTKGAPARFPCSRKAKKSAIMLVTIDKTGKLTRKAITGHDELDTYFRPSLSNQLENTNQLFLFTEKKRDMRFGIATF